MPKKILVDTMGGGGNLSGSCVNVAPLNGRVLISIRDAWGEVSAIQVTLEDAEKISKGIAEEVALIKQGQTDEPGI